MPLKNSFFKETHDTLLCPKNDWLFLAMLDFVSTPLSPVKIWRTGEMRQIYFLFFICVLKALAPEELMELQNDDSLSRINSKINVDVVMFFKSRSEQFYLYTIVGFGRTKRPCPVLLCSLTNKTGRCAPLLTPRTSLRCIIAFRWYLWCMYRENPRKIPV